MATFAANDSAMFWPCRFSDSFLASHRRTFSRNDEIWFRIFGDNLQFNFRAPTTTPISISVDGGAWSTAGGLTAASTSVTNLSGNVLPGGTTDNWHDIKLRMRDGGNWLGLRTVDGVVVTSTGGSAQLAAHTDKGEYEQTRGTRALLYWRDTFSDVTVNATFTSPIFPRGQLIAGSTKVGRNAYAEFYVDTNTTKVWAFVQNGFGTVDGQFGVFVDNKRLSSQQTPGTTDGTHGLYGPITIPGSGTRLVRLTNLYGLEGVVTDGAFVDTAVPAKTKKVAWVGDSVTSADSATSDGGGGNALDASGGWDQLCEIVNGTFVSYNRGLSGASVTPFNSNSRQNDIPSDADIVINNLCINDVSGFVSTYATTVAAYVTMYNAILTRCTNATLLCVAQLPYQAANRATAIGGIQEAVTTVANARCIYVSSDNWVSGLNSGSHPRDMGKAQACAGGVAAIRVAANPSDGDTLTINGTVFEFDNNASVTGGRTAVTIGAAVTDTIENLAVAIDAASGFDLLGRIILASDTGNQGVCIRECTSLAKSGTNLTVYGPEAEGWLTMLNSYLSSGGGGSYQNLPLLGVG
jgi:lysophospholipase L1-like esterase